ncbi:MAG TPA: hypothetical protein GYA08_19580, partial [Chloroflexi bacterium]|nr:hypothetical protein [Chloroflexota bacterium]
DVETQNFASLPAARVQQLEERYAEPLPAIEAEVAALRQRVLGHLARMGVEWTVEVQP